MQGSTKFLQWFRRRCDNGENQRWLSAAILSTDRNHFRACTNRSLGEHLRQVSKKSDQWSRRRCDNEIVTVLNKGQIAILKMAAIRPYLLTDPNLFRADKSRH